MIIQPTKYHISNEDFHQLGQLLARKLLTYFGKHEDSSIARIKIYAVPRGGLPFAHLLMGIFNAFEVVEHPEQADAIVDDLIDSGATRDLFRLRYPNKPFFAGLDKTDITVKPEVRSSWVVWPWERASLDNEDEGIERNVLRMLQHFEPATSNRAGLTETPQRVSKAWKHWTKGYNVDIAKLFKVFEDGGEKYNQMIIVKDIPIYSKCEHHLADIFGTADIAYIPNGKIVGLSKLSRVADAFARRLQVQERLTQQIADAVQEHLTPVGVGVRIKARHMCMESRGICQQGHSTITTAFHGALLNDVSARNEFLSQLTK